MSVLANQDVSTALTCHEKYDVTQDMHTEHRRCTVVCILSHRIPSTGESYSSLWPIVWHICNKLCCPRLVISKAYQTLAQAFATPKPMHVLHKYSFCCPCVNKRPDHLLTVHWSEESTKLLSGRCASGHKASARAPGISSEMVLDIIFWGKPPQGPLWCVWLTAVLIDQASNKCRRWRLFFVGPRPHAPGTVGLGKNMRTNQISLFFRTFPYFQYCSTYVCSSH